MRGRDKRFRFENAWIAEPLCGQIIHVNWEADDRVDIQEKIKNCAINLGVWGKEITGCFAKRIKECKLQLKYLRAKRDINSVQEYKLVKQQLFLILDQREVFWR